MRIWIDTSDCDSTYHEIVREEGKLFCNHADGSTCNDAEFKVEEDEQ